MAALFGQVRRHPSCWSHHRFLYPVTRLSQYFWERRVQEEKQKRTKIPPHQSLPLYYYPPPPMRLGFLGSDNIKENLEGELKGIIYCQFFDK